MKSFFWKPILLLGLILGIAEKGVQSWANSSEIDIKNAILAKMKDRHPGDLQEFWATLGPEALPVLKTWWSSNPTEKEKIWILEGLSRFQDPEIAVLMRGAVKTSESDPILKKKMLGTWIRSQGEEALDDVEPFLDDPNEQIRKTVAESLKKYAGSSKRVKDRLASFLSTEKEAWIKDSILRASEEDRGTGRMKLNRGAQVFAETTPAVSPPAPLAEKDWVGKWKGAWVTPLKSTAAEVEFKLVNAAALERGDRSVQVWRIDLRLPPRSRQELKESDYQIESFVTASAHWLRLRSKKADTVLLLHRSVKK